MNKPTQHKDRKANVSRIENESLETKEIRVVTDEQSLKAAVIATRQPTLDVEDLAGAPEKPKPPVRMQVVTNDVTTEKLGSIMGNNPRGIIRLSDELTGFIRTMNLYHGGHGADRQFYLSAWSGSAAQVDRQSLAKPILIPNPQVVITGGIQPDLLSTLEDERGRDDGFIDRFLFTFPTPTGRREWDASSGVSQQIRQVWENTIDFLFNLALQEPEGQIDTEPQPRTLKLSKEAEALWVKWHKAHWDETEWDCFPPHLRGVWSKFEIHAFTLVLIAHMLKIASEYVLTGKEYAQIDPPIDEESMCRGLKLADYFKHHNVRVFNRLKVSTEDLKAQRVIAWVRKRPGKRATARDLQSNGVVGIKTSTAAKAMLKDLEDRGWGVMKSPAGSNRKATCFEAA